MGREWISGFVVKFRGAERLVNGESDTEGVFIVKL